jgi:hypothetical protein
MIVGGVVTMASDRTFRRHLQQTLAVFRQSPEYRAMIRRRKRRRFPNEPRWLINRWCARVGRERGGRSPDARRCTKRLGTRVCWNWRTRAADRCYRHPRVSMEGERANAL